MKILMIYPEFPDTFWSFKYALKFINKKSSFPPLGLLTIASFLPKEWEVKLIDMNVQKLKEEIIEWADYIFISAMLVQKESVDNILTRVKKYYKKIIAGGPLFTTGFIDYPDIDSIVIGEAELIMPQLINDILNDSLKHIYKQDEKPDLKYVPLPKWDLINFKNYASMSVQYSRGCPFDCEFCDIVLINGRIPRTKYPEQMIKEFDILYEKKWRGSLFIVDDNFIGNKRNVKEMLKYIIKWQKERHYPFNLFTEASINLADDDELMDLMVEANFNKVFIGVETPEEESLKEVNKIQNTKRNLIDDIKILQKKGFEVMGGFIVGFDNDNISIFDKMKKFIQKSGIVTAMVGILNVLPETKLFYRLKKENRILKISSGNNTDFLVNFIPKSLTKDKLVEGYKNIIKDLYSYKIFYQRVWNFIKNYKPKNRHRICLSEVYPAFLAFLKSTFKLGIIENSRFYYWKVFIQTLIKNPKAIITYVTLTIYGYHFKKSYEISLKRNLIKTTS
ncbi:MAG: B12-binding domain-containing radical SAM protein [Caldisericia bacterium]